MSPLAARKAATPVPVAEPSSSKSRASSPTQVYLPKCEAVPLSVKVAGPSDERWMSPPPCSLTADWANVDDGIVNRAVNAAKSIGRKTVVRVMAVLLCWGWVIALYHPAP